MTKEWPLPIKLVLARIANLQIENVRLNASLCPLLNTNQLAGFISSSTDLMITMRHLSRTNSINTLWMNQLYLYICLRVVGGWWREAPPRRLPAGNFHLPIGGDLICVLISLLAPINGHSKKNATNTTAAGMELQIASGLDRDWIALESV